MAPIDDKQRAERKMLELLELLENAGCSADQLHLPTRPISCRQGAAA
jgi:hypothetical protein